MNRFMFAVMATVFMTVEAGAQAPPKHQLDRIEDNQLEILRKQDLQLKLAKETLDAVARFEKSSHDRHTQLMGEVSKIYTRFDAVDVALKKNLDVGLENQAKLGKILSSQDEILLGLDKVTKLIRAIEDGQEGLRRQVRELASRPPEVRTVYVDRPVVYYYPVERTYYVNVGYSYYRYYNGYWYYA